MDKIQMNLDFLQPKDAWDKLSLAEKADMMEIAVRNGITNLQDIRKKYNEFAEGGDITPLEYTHQRFPVTQEFVVYPYVDKNFTPEGMGNIEYMDAVHDSLPYYNNYQKPDSLKGKAAVVYNNRMGDATNEAVALDILSHGLREQDPTWRKKYLTTLHDTFEGDAIYNMTDRDKAVYNLNDPEERGEVIDNYIDGYIRTMAVDDKYRKALNYASRKEFNREYNQLPPEQQNALAEAYSYIHPTQLPEITVTGNKRSEGGNLFGGGSYMDKAKALIKENEKWKATPYKDAPKGKKWRSVGYGFNDSGFLDKYPEGISNHYEKGITKAQAEQELDWYLTRADNHLRKMYGNKWDTFTDGQKAAILDTYYQRPASVAKGSVFYGNVMSGKGTMTPGVSGYSGRNRKRKKAFLGLDTEPYEVPTVLQPAQDNTFVFNPYVLQQQATLPYSEIVSTPTTLPTLPSEAELKAQRRAQEATDNRWKFNLAMSLLNGQDPVESFLQNFMPNPSIPLFEGLPEDQYAKGGKIHIKPSHRGRLTELKKRTGKSEAELYRTGSPAVRKMITFARNARKWKHANGGYLNNSYGNTFGGGGVFGNETVDTVASFLPILGTAEDAYTFYKDPSWANAGWLTLSLGSDIFTGGMAGRAIKAARMASRAEDVARAANNAARQIWNANRWANINAGKQVVRGADMRRSIEAVKAAEASHRAAHARAVDAYRDAGIKSAVDQGFNAAQNATQMELWPDFGYGYRHSEGGPLHGPLVEAALAHQYGPGGDTNNPMNYQILGTVKDDDLKKEGITQLAFLPEVTVVGQDRTKPYYSAYDSSLKPYGEFFGALAHGLQPLSPSQHYGAAADAIQGKRGYFDSLFNGNSGFFSDQFTAEHPISTMIWNMAGDAGVGIGAAKALPAVQKAASAASEGAEKALTLFNSPITGNWTTFGNKQYRFKPDYVGMNSTPIESKPVPTILDELPLGDNRYYRAVDQKALDSYREMGKISQFDADGTLRSRYEVPMFSKERPSQYRTGDPRTVWAVSKPEANLEWEAVNGTAMSPKLNGRFNEAPITDFDFYIHDPQRGYIQLDSNLNLPEGIKVSETPHIDYLKGLSEQQQIEYLTQNGLNDQWLWTLKNNPSHLESALSKAPLPYQGPAITAENAASMTKAQWIAAQDAAIARGDMAEAQRLRNLHLDAKIPSTQVTDLRDLKSADAVTYNPETGERIPLGDRDDFSNPDIRYSLESDFKGKPAALSAGKVMRKADSDVSEMNKYHQANVDAYNEATGSNVQSIPFRTDYTGRRVQVLPNDEFNAKMAEFNVNAPAGTVENIGGVYSKRNDTVYLRNTGNPSNNYHEFLHSAHYGETNPDVTRWRISQLVDEKKVAELSPKEKGYYLSEMEAPTHLRQQGEKFNIEIGQEYPGDEAFDELWDSGVGGASYYMKHSTPEEKRLLWKGWNGTLFGLTAPTVITMSAAANSQALGGPIVQDALRKYSNGGNLFLTGGDSDNDNDNEPGIFTKGAIWLGKKLGIADAFKGKADDAQYRQSIYNGVDPTDAIPNQFGKALQYAGVATRANMGTKFAKNRHHNDPAADAAWAKRLGLPYDKNILIDNGDGSVRLSDSLEAQIPVDTVFLKQRIADNEARLNKVSGPARQHTQYALDYDRDALEALRKTYATGEPVEMNEGSAVGRNWRTNDPERLISPLNLFHRYTVQYDKDKNAMNYWDWYDFNDFENFVPGDPFKIKGSINLKKKRKK